MIHLFAYRIRSANGGISFDDRRTTTTQLPAGRFRSLCMSVVAVVAAATNIALLHSHSHWLIRRGGDKSAEGRLLRCSVQVPLGGFFSVYFEYRHESPLVVASGRLLLLPIDRLAGGGEARNFPSNIWTRPQLLNFRRRRRHSCWSNIRKLKPRSLDPNSCICPGMADRKVTLQVYSCADFIGSWEASRVSHRLCIG